MSDTVRKFNRPTVNFNATSYVDMIDWKKEIITEPPLTMCYSRKQLLNSVKLRQILPFPDIPNHTQGVERMIKLVTEASKTVHDHKKTTLPHFTNIKIEKNSECINMYH